MRTLIKVQTKHIKNGHRGSASCCPVALAVRETIGRLLYVCTNKTGPYENPRSVKRFIKRFDAKKSVKPFNFFLDIK